MIELNSFKKTVQFIAGLLVLGTIAGTIPAFANEAIITEPKPLNVSTGTVKDLQGIEEKTSSEWLGGVGEGEDISDSQADYQSQADYYDTRVLAINQTWEITELNLTHINHPTRRFYFPE
jgi:hypothetical protein